MLHQRKYRITFSVWKGGRGGVREVSQVSGFQFRRVERIVICNQLPYHWSLFSACSGVFGSDRVRRRPFKIVAVFRI